MPANPNSADPDPDHCELPYEAPYAWAELLRFLGRRAIPGVEVVADGTYRRSLRLADGGQGWLQVQPAAEGRSALRMQWSPALRDAVAVLQARVRHVFDLDAKPPAIAAVLGPLAAVSAGLRVPGAFGGFEIAVRALLGQQVTVAAARTLAARFARAFGSPLAEAPAEIGTLFPEPGVVAEAALGDIASLGIVRVRAEALRQLAQAMAAGTLRLEPGQPPAPTVAALEAMPGIGPWTAHYIAMRALGWRDAFPHADHGVRKALGLSSDKAVLAHAEAWRPFRAYAVMHLWRSLEKAA